MKVYEMQNKLKRTRNGYNIHETFKINRQRYRKS